MERCVAHATELAQLAERHGTGCGGKCGDDAFVDRDRPRRRCVGLLNHGEREGGIAPGEFECDAGEGGRSAMLDGECQMSADRATQIEVRVAPGVELGGAAQRLACANVAGGLLRVMHEEHGEGVPALKFAQICQERCDLPARILIDAMQSNEGIQDQKPRGEGLDGALEALAIPFQIKSQGGGGDHLHIQCRELAAGRLADALEARAHDVLGVLGGEEQHAPGSGNGEAPQRRVPGGDRDCEVECEEALAALGLTAHDADGALAPETLDEPALLLGPFGQAMRGLDRQDAHRLRPAPAATFSGVAVLAGGVKVSKNSCSSI